jgi:hypothetical protein
MNPLSEPHLLHKENIFLHLRRAVETIHPRVSWAESPPVLWIIQQFFTAQIQAGSRLLVRMREVVEIFLLDKKRVECTEKALHVLGFQLGSCALSVTHRELQGRWRSCWQEHASWDKAQLCNFNGLSCGIRDELCLSFSYVKWGQFHSLPRVVLKF